jgi:hypothetical protein
MAKELSRDTARKRLLSMPPEERAALLKRCGDARHTVRHILIEDLTPEQYGKRFNCNGPAMLDIALERISRVLA